MRKRFKPVYEVRRRDLVYPKEAYRNVWYWLLGVQSPSCVFSLMFSNPDAYAKYRYAYFSHIKQRVNKRRATREEYWALRRYERLTKEVEKC